MKIIAIAIALLAGLCSAQAQRVGFAYWDVERLYDTIPSPFYDDTAFTPGGRMGWTAERYRRKVEAVAAVVDSLAMPVTVLYGVENEAVVRDMAAACRSDYSYLHLTLDTRNGLEFAVLYYGDAVMVERAERYRRNVMIHCRIAGRRTVLVLSCYAVDAERMAARVRRDDADAVLIVMGRQTPAKMTRLGLNDAFAAEERAGRGQRLRGGVWRFDERICTDTMLTVRAAVYARRELFDPVTSAPRPTFTARGYAGGVSRSLPLAVIAEWPDEAARGEKNGEKVGVVEKF